MQSQFEVGLLFGVIIDLKSFFGGGGGGGGGGGVVGVFNAKCT